MWETVPNNRMPSVPLPHFHFPQARAFSAKQLDEPDNGTNGSATGRQQSDGASASLTTTASYFKTTEATAVAQTESFREYREARLKGYEGDPCTECGQLTLVRNGTCLRCDSCGTTTGCS